MGQPIPKNKQQEYSQKMTDLKAKMLKWQQLASSEGFGMQDTDELKQIHDACVKLANDLKGKF